MSRFFNAKFDQLTPYVPGEQPRDERSYIKLNTNELPFSPCEEAIEAAARAAQRLNLYCDPQAADLTAAIAQRFNVPNDQIVVGNGSDEILNFIFMAYGGSDFPAVFPDITYGFYPVYAQVNRVPYEEVPLRGDFSLNLEDYGVGGEKLFVFANPNAPTGLALPADCIARFAQSNPDSVVVVDEAYVDFGAESCVPLVGKLDNLIVVQTFSKSRGLAGARFGFAIGNAALIADLQSMRYSTNPYNVNAMTQAAALATIEHDEVMRDNAREIARVRQSTSARLKELGFSGPESRANFLFMKHERIAGAVLYERLKQAGILVRHFDKPRIRDYVRITVGTQEQMTALLVALEDIIMDGVPWDAAAG